MDGKTQMRPNFLHQSARNLEKCSIGDSKTVAAARHSCLASMTRRHDRVRSRSDGSHWWSRATVDPCGRHRVDVFALTLGSRVSGLGSRVSVPSTRCKTHARRSWRTPRTMNVDRHRGRPRVTSLHDWLSSDELSKVPGNMSRRSSSHVDTAASNARPKRSVASA